MREIRIKNKKDAVLSVGARVNQSYEQHLWHDMSDIEYYYTWIWNLNQCVIWTSKMLWIPIGLSINSDSISFHWMDMEHIIRSRDL